MVFWTSEFSNKVHYIVQIQQHVLVLTATQYKLTIVINIVETMKLHLMHLKGDR